MGNKPHEIVLFCFCLFGGWGVIEICDSFVTKLKLEPLEINNSMNAKTKLFLTRIQISDDLFFQLSNQRKMNEGKPTSKIIISFAIRQKSTFSKACDIHCAVS